jgi:serine/threonine protein kinase
MSEPISSIGKYKIFEELAHGGFATVYKAVDTTLDREVALKVLDPLLTRDPAFIGRFQQEARMTAKLFHPNIAALFEVGQAEGRYFLAMQYILGHDLRDLVQETGPLPFDQITAIIQQIGAALDYAHMRGAIHRDVKPSNIIFDDSGHATLTDFGIVKALEATTIQTTNGAILGTPSYSSPEQVESKPLDGRSDLYSLGVVAYELFTGKVPFMADTTPSLYYKIVHEEPPSPSQVNARVADPIEQALLKAIAKQPDQRYQSGQEFAVALSAAVEHVKGQLIQSLYTQALTLSKEDDWDAAEADLRQVLAMQPGRQDAESLLDKISRRRESVRRYKELVDAVEKARVQVAELKQADPDLADPDGVLGMFVAEPGPRIAPPAPESIEQTRTIPLKTIAIVLLASAVLAFILGVSIARTAASKIANAEVVTNLAFGNLMLGMGLGAGLGGLIMLGLSGRKFFSEWRKVIR